MLSIGAAYFTVGSLLGDRGAIIHLSAGTWWLGVAIFSFKGSGTSSILSEGPMVWTAGVLRALGGSRATLDAFYYDTWDGPLE